MVSLAIFQKKTRKGRTGKGGFQRAGGGVPDLDLSVAICHCLFFFPIGNGPNTVSESTVSNTELSEFFWGSLSSGERTQWVPLSLLFVCQSELTEFFAELTEFDYSPEGPERHLDAARQKLPRDNFCRSIAAQLPSPRGQFWMRKKCPLLWGRGNLGGILRDNLGEGHCESKIAARQWGVNLFEHTPIPAQNSRDIRGSSLRNPRNPKNLFGLFLTFYLARQK